jgi:hypothetical protein
MLLKEVFKKSTHILVGSARKATATPIQLVRHASAFKFMPDTAPSELGETTKMNLYQAVTNALDITLSSDKSSG